MGMRAHRVLSRRRGSRCARMRAWRVGRLGGVIASLVAVVALSASSPALAGVGDSAARALVEASSASSAPRSSRVPPLAVLSSAANNRCAQVNLWTINVTGFGTYFFVRTGGGWVSSFNQDGSSPFGTVSLSVSGNSFSATNPYLNGRYTAVFHGTLARNCTIGASTPLGNWSAHGDINNSGTFSAQGLLPSPVHKVTISGRLSEPVCDDGVCNQQRGVKGIEVVAQGASGSGHGVSNKDGDWSIPVHPGTLTIAPQGNGWAPSPGCPSKGAASCTLVVTGDTPGVDFSRCAIDNTVSGWRFKGDCPSVDDWKAGAKNVEITPPGGLLTVSEPTDNDPLPVVDQDHRYELALPVVLPDLSLDAGGVHVGAYENTVDKPGAPDAGVNIGLGTASVQGFTAAVDDLNPQNGTASDLELQFGDSAVTFDGSPASYRDGTFEAGTFTVGLPSLLGGGSLSGENLRVGSGGVAARVTGGSFSFGGLSVEVENAKVEDDVLSVGLANVELPAYLGVQSSSLHFRDLRWDFKTGALTGSATGEIHMSIGNHFKADVTGTLAITDGHWSINADGSVEVPSSEGGSPLFMAHAHLEIQQPVCPAPPAVGTTPCGDGRFLQKADLSIQGGEPVPLGETGFAIDGLDAHVNVLGSGSIDASGAIQGFTYTFGLGAHVLTEDGGKLFQGHVGGTLSTDGNLALTLDKASALDGLLTVDGEVCVIQSLPNDVCDTDTNGPSGFPLQGAGVFIDGHVDANVSYAVAKVCEGHLGLDATADGVLDLNDPHVKLTGTLKVGARCELFPSLPAFDGRATIGGILGLFRKGDGPAQPGILGTLDGSLVVRHPNGSTSTIKEDGAFFIGTVERKLITDGADQYTEVGSGAADLSLWRGSQNVLVSARGPAQAVVGSTTGASDGTAKAFLLAGTRGCTGLSVECGPAITASARRPLRSVATSSDTSTLTPGQQPTKALPWKSVPGTTAGGCGYGVEWTGTQTQTSHQTGPASRRLWRLASNGVPILDVSPSDGACVAANIYAAITGTDPATGQTAVNVIGGKYVAITSSPGWTRGGWAQLHYGVASNKINTSKQNRSSSCGNNPFSAKHSPGPLDKPISNTNDYFSCDEFPFASTIEGGRKDGRFSVIRGVPLAQNTNQGRLLWDFYRANLPTLKTEPNKGLFDVCVDYPGQPPAGICH